MLNGGVFWMRPELPPMRAEFGQMAEVSFMVKSDAGAFGAQHQALDNVPGPQRLHSRRGWWQLLRPQEPRTGAPLLRKRRWTTIALRLGAVRMAVRARSMAISLRSLLKGERCRRTAGRLSPEWPLSPRC